MKMIAGLWIDHRRALIAIVTKNEEKTLEIQSNTEVHPERTANTRSTASDETQQEQAVETKERDWTGQLHFFYDAVIAAVRDAESILIYGPGEAKYELKKRLEHAKLGNLITAIETVDKMTDHQITAKVRQYFHELSPAQV